jgi:hypothetical protein
VWCFLAGSPKLKAIESASQTWKGCSKCPTCQIYLAEQLVCCVPLCQTRTYVSIRSCRSAPRCHCRKVRARCHGSTEGRGSLHLRHDYYRAFVFQETFAGLLVCTAPAVFNWRGLAEVQVFVAVARHRTAKLPTGSTTLFSQQASPSSSTCYEHAPLGGMAVWTFEKVVGGCTISVSPGARVMGRSYRNGLKHFTGTVLLCLLGNGMGGQVEDFSMRSPVRERSGKPNVNILQGQTATGMLLLVASRQSCYSW